MKSFNTHLRRETLLITNTTLSKWFWKTQAKDAFSLFSNREQLEAACNNRLLEKLLPKIINHPLIGISSSKWQVEIRNSALRVSDCDSSSDCEKHFTICYQGFLSRSRMN